MTMRFRSLKYILKQGIIGMWRNRMMSLASIGSVTSALMILGIILILILNINNLTYMTREEFDEIQIYLKEDISKEKVINIGNKLKQQEGVNNVTFKSQKDALKSMKEQWGEESYLLEGLEDNPFPNSYIIQLKSIDYADSVVSGIKNIEGIEDIKYFNDIVKKMITISRVVRSGGLIVIGILIFISIFIISNTIKITVAARKKEISIMKYVGATNNFIRGPFVIEGMFLGILGSIIAIAIIGYGYKYLVEFANQKLYVFATVYMVPYYKLFNDIVIMFISIGVGIGIIGSIISLRKFLNV